MYIYIVWHGLSVSGWPCPMRPTRVFIYSLQRNKRYKRAFPGTLPNCREKKVWFLDNDFTWDIPKRQPAFHTGIICNMTHDNAVAPDFMRGNPSNVMTLHTVLDPRYGGPEAEASPARLKAFRASPLFFFFLFFLSLFSAFSSLFPGWHRPLVILSPFMDP